MGLAGGSGSLLSGGGTGSGGLAPAPLNPLTLNALGGQIQTADPGLAGAVGSALHTPLSLVGGLFKVANIPGEFIRKTLLGSPTGAQYLSNQGVKGNDWTSKLLRGIGGFGIDAATDPLTYLTGGTEGIAKSAAEKTLLHTGLTHLGAEGLDTAVQAAEKGGQPLAEWAATHANPVVRDFAAGTQGQASYARALQNAEHIAPGVGAKLPDNISGGLRLRVPFGEKLGIDKQLTLVPSRVTSKLTAPFAEALKEGVVPGGANSLTKAAAAGASKVYGGLASNLSRSWDVVHGARVADRAAGAEGAGSGLGGAILRDATGAANRGKVAAMASANDLVKQITTAFGGTPEARDAFRLAVETPGAVALSAAQKEVVDKFTQSFAPDLLARAQAAGLDAHTMGDKWFPRVYTDEANAVKRGTAEAQNAEASIRAGTQPGAFNERFLKVPFDQAQEMESARLSQLAGKPVTAFESDPVRAILRSASDTNGKIAGKQLEQALSRSQLIKSTLATTDSGVAKSELDRLGVIPQDAREAFLHGATADTHPWLDQLTPETRAGLAAEADKVRAQTGEILPGLHDQTAKSTAYLSRLSTSYLDKSGRVSDAAAAFGEKGSQLQQRLDEINQTHMPAAEADRMAAWNRVQATDARLSNLEAQIETHRTSAGLLDPHPYMVAQRNALRQGLSTVRAQGDQALSDFRAADQAVTGLTQAKNDISSQLASLHSSPEAQRANRLLDSTINTEKAVTRQQSKLDELSLQKTNLEAGLQSSGDQWPMAFKNGAMPEGWRTIQNASIGAFNGKPAPSWIANEVENALRIEKTGDLAKAIDQYNNFFKRIVTVPFPHFWMKRAMGGWFVNYLGGVSVAEHELAHTLIQAIDHGLPEETAIGSHTVGEWKSLLEGQGILKNPALGETADLLRQNEPSLMHQPGFGLPGVKQVSGGIQKLGASVLSKIDDTARAAAFMHAYEHLGDAEGARLFMLQRHGDFSEMTHFEKGVMSRVVPFYKWIRIKTPLILQNIAENPGRVINASRFQQEVLGDPTQTAQQYASGMFPTNEAFKGGFIAGPLLDPLMHALGSSGPVAVNTDLPTYTLNTLTNPLADIQPVLQSIIGLGTHTQIWPTGAQPLKMTTPVKGVYRQVAQVMEHVPGLNQLALRTPGGDLRMDSRVYELLSQLPSSSVASVADSLPQAVQGSGTTALKVLTPFTAKEITPQVQQGALAGQKAALNALVSELYRRGEAAQFKAAKPTTHTKKGKLG